LTHLTLAVRKKQEKNDLRVPKIAREVSAIILDSLVLVLIFETKAKNSISITQKNNYCEYCVADSL
jgi:hypothetical protein